MPADINSSYKKLLERYKNLVVLGSAEAIVHWDMETKMPPKAVKLRSEQLALLSEIRHKMSISPSTGKHLDVVLKHPNFEELGQLEKRSIELVKKNYDEQTKLPTRLVSEIAKQQAIAVNTWKKAKATKNWEAFKPELQKLVDLNKRAAAILMKVKQTKTPYDALIDIYEPKMASQTISRVFRKLEQGLRALLEKILASSNQPDTSVLTRNVPVEKQREITHLLVQTLGYDVASPNAAGRVDETEHPFTTGYYDDVRITTHYYPNNLASSIFSVLHETGHALYEQNLPQEWKYLPAGAPCSMGFHESQSRLFENIIGRSQEFWSALLPKVKSTAAPSFDEVTLDKFIRAVNTVKPSKIRIEADEVTYSLHIIIRFRIENELFADKITVQELPAVWNQEYKDLLGLTVENDSEGVMQDTHWASGYYGYFPAYALGNIYSGQTVQALTKVSPQWLNNLSKGDLSPVQKWLGDNIYRYGNLYDPADLLEKATGARMNVEPYLDYLRSKFSWLYGF